MLTFGEHLVYQVSMSIRVERTMNDALGSRNRQRSELRAHLLNSSVTLMPNLLACPLEQNLSFRSRLLGLLTAITLRSLARLYQHTLAFLTSLVQGALHRLLLLLRLSPHPIRLFQAVLDSAGAGIEHPQNPLVRQEVEDHAQEGKVHHVDKQADPIDAQGTDAACFFS